MSLSRIGMVIRSVWKQPCSQQGRKLDFIFGAKPGKVLKERRIAIRGVGGMNCHHCGSEIKVERFVGRTDECHKCGSDLHSCVNCANYDTTLSNRCREPNTEWIPDREKANFCDFFTPSKA